MSSSGINAREHNLTRKTEKRFNFNSVDKRGRHSFFSDTKLQVDQIKRKIVARFNKPLLFKKSNTLTVNTTIIFRIKN